MKTTIQLCSIITALLFTVTSAFAESGYRFSTTERCQLKKLHGKSWEPASLTEVEGVDLDVKPAKNSTTQSMAKVGNTWYAAPTHCFVRPGEEESGTSSDTTHSNKKTSEFMHQAAPEVLEVTPQLVYTALTISFKNAAVEKYAIRGFTSAVLVEYGFSDYLTLGAQLSYSNLKSSYTPELLQSTTQKGLADPHLILNGMISSDVGNLRYGVDFSFALEKSKTDINGSSNAASGGMEFAPMLGYEFNLGNSMLGFRAEAGLKGSRTQVGPFGTESKVSGGNSYSGDIFYELHLEPTIIGLDLAYVYSSSSKSETNGIVSENGDKISAYGAALYARFCISKMIDIIPSFAYAKYNVLGGLSPSDNISISGIATGAKVRFKF